MSTPTSSGGADRDSLSDHARLLAERAEEAIRDGTQLLRWCTLSDDQRGIEPFALNLRKPFRLPNHAQGYFGTLPMNGTQVSVMGCRQQVQFGRVTDGNASQALRQFVVDEFLPRAHWTYEDGSPGGFTIEQILYKTAPGGYGVFGPQSRMNCVSWEQLGLEYAWVLVILHLHDFVMDIGPIRKQFREAACVVLCPGFFSLAESPSPTRALRISIGYPFVRYAPIPNYFGFGPGKFGVAIKLFSFSIDHNNQVHVEMEFAAAPRCQKVFDFGSSLPDPIYGGARLLEMATFGWWKTGPFHDKLDAVMLEQHCRVHQALMDGTERIWTRWLNGGAR